MLVPLQYNNKTSLSTCAAFIRGNDPARWLREINRWNIVPSQLECYLVPESIQSLRPAGLFVVINTKNEQELKQIDFLEPYGVFAGKLYVPVGASLYPELGLEELQYLLIWEKQLFHPVIGLVGFSTADKVNLTDLLASPQLGNANWNLAHPGNSPKPRLRQIHVQQPTIQDVLDSFKQSIEKKPLSEIPKSKKEEDSTPASCFLDSMKRGALKAGLFASDKLKSALTPSPTSGNNGSSTELREGFTNGNMTNSHRPGLLDRLDKWLKENLEDLENKRKNEIKRLLDLFEDDTDEALRYAIPLDSAYQGRGIAPPSSTLTRSSSDFSLGGLGGGGLVDGWDVGDYYNDLRTKYNYAAKKEIEAKNYKKAAYVYAHLLGDFRSAANVLEQGKHYRDAAVLYKEHLKDVYTAAQCLERGGLYMESVELYVKLQKHEKAGDLYTLLGHVESAEHHYEQCIVAVLKNNDYLDASRIMLDKLEQPERAKETLLAGWTKSGQSESCLNRYFDVVAASGKGNLYDYVEQVYKTHLPHSRKTTFLNVLVTLNQKNKNPELQETCRSIAYELISEQANVGNLTNLSTLKQFIPDDRLIASDCSRYINNVKNSQRSKPKSTIQLDKSIKWITAICHRNQFLALGIKDANLHLARGNWFDHVEYYSWSDYIKPTTQLKLIVDQYNSNQIILHTSSGMALEDKVMPKNKHYDDELIVKCPTWLSKGFLGLKLSPEGSITALAVSQAAITIQYYTKEFNLEKSVNCRFENQQELLFFPVGSLSEMFYRNHYYFTYTASTLLRIAESGIMESVQFSAVIKKLVASAYSADFRLAIATNKGCLLLKPSESDLLKAGEAFFAEQMDIIDLSFVSADYLLLAEKHKVALYKIEDGVPTYQQAVETSSPIVSILQTSGRYQACILEESGKISIYDIET